MGGIRTKTHLTCRESRFTPASSALPGKTAQSAPSVPPSPPSIPVGDSRLPRLVASQAAPQPASLTVRGAERVTYVDNWYRVVGDVSEFPNILANCGYSGGTSLPAEVAVQLLRAQPWALEVEGIQAAWGDCTPPCRYPRVAFHIYPDHVTVDTYTGECPRHNFERRERQRQEALREAGVPPRLVAASLGDFPENEFLKAFVARGTDGGVFIEGPPRVGKSHLAAAIMHDFIHRSDYHWDPVLQRNTKIGMWMSFASFRDMTLRRVGKDSVPTPEYDDYLAASIAVLDGVRSEKPLWVDEYTAAFVSRRIQAGLPTILTGYGVSELSRNLQSTVMDYCSYTISLQGRPW